MGLAREVEMSPEALGILNDAQRNRIRGMFEGNGGCSKVQVFIDMSLPTNWVYVIQYWPDQRQPIHGGIDPNGSMST